MLEQRRRLGGKRSKSKEHVGEANAGIDTYVPGKWNWMAKKARLRGRKKKRKEERKRREETSDNRVTKSLSGAADGDGAV